LIFLPAGLFHNVITSSGSAVNPWILTIDQNRFNRKLAALMGASDSDIADPAKRVQYLRSVNSKKMTNRMFDVVEGEVSTSNDFAIVGSN